MSGRAKLNDVQHAIDDLPRAADGRVDVGALARSLRAATGRLHRFDSQPPEGGGWTYLAVPSGRSTRPPVDDLRLPSPDRATDGLPTHVLALPYERDQPAFVEEVEGVVALRGDEVRTRGELPPLAPVPPSVSPAVGRQAVHEPLGRAGYLAGVAAIVEAIASGDVYLVNLTQQLHAAWRSDLHALYDALRAASPAPHGAVVELTAGTGLASISPETFVRAHGRHLEIRPIKGTRPRSSDRDDDRRLAGELAASEKERAENVMVVDLERNDLGQVCETGSVAVPQLWEVEGHPTLWQLVSTVTGRLRRELDYGDVLAACSPCGSVTGAPKTAAIRTAAALERGPRGWYCGAVGWAAPGRLETAVTIRTAVLVADGTVTYGTGAGIVADSDPDAEYEETWLKALPFLRAVGGRRPDPSGGVVP